MSYNPILIIILIKTCVSGQICTNLKQKTMNVQLIKPLAHEPMCSFSARLCIVRFLRSQPLYATPMLSNASQSVYTDMDDCNETVTNLYCRWSMFTNFRIITH